MTRNAPVGFTPQLTFEPNLTGHNAHDQERLILQPVYCYQERQNIIHCHGLYDITIRTDFVVLNVIGNRCQY